MRDADTLAPIALLTAIGLLGLVAICSEDETTRLPVSARAVRSIALTLPLVFGVVAGAWARDMSISGVWRRHARVSR